MYTFSSFFIPSLISFIVYRVYSIHTMFLLYRFLYSLFPRYNSGSVMMVELDLSPLP
ncbi:uncharacterized protein EURHEDRAFT_508652 [Aspergillus ruber CBS 135680]|uniref:Uncharacterized protein n=1 Tax=Aspergillus ruber (strain CBS 135680) TaxID=1388766 RepID=A0A017S5F4_ASPRC|nr:uncharacterized protein EURHEDRAFT_508652 [Aspergillus ruber CBS 135680]EYE91400.1 hypothetical protein EURHEDRAFT_508652 [Aspergillus ruber CBS 135680]